jgi:hypothetical protein
MDQLRLIRLIFLRILIFLLILAVVMGFHHIPFYTSPYSILARALIALVTALATLIYIHHMKIRKLETSSVHPPIVPIPPGRAVSLQKRVGLTRPVTSLEAQVFALAITNPAIFRPRIVELYEPSRRTIHQEVTVDIQLPRELFDAHVSDSTAGVSINDTATEAEQRSAIQGESTATDRLETPKILLIPFPAVVPIKGELNDDFLVLGIDGSRLPTFSYSEYLELVAGVLRMLLLKACYLEDKGNLHKIITKVELSALRCIMQRGLQPASQVASTVTAILDLKTLNIADDHEATRYPNNHVVSLVAEVVRQLANRYAIVASVDCNSDYRALLRYERTMVPGLKLAGYKEEHRIRWLKDRLSILLGSRPVSLRIPLSTAATCQSYHLVARCPEGLYLRAQEFPGLENYLTADARRRDARRRANNADVSIPPYYHVRSRLGQPYAHFYSRYFVEPTIAREVSGSHTASVTKEATAAQMTDTGDALSAFPKADVTFVEVPPGSLFRAAIAALSAFLLIWLVGFITSRGRDPGTDSPAILLAFPAVLAGWLGVDAPPRRLLEGTLAARLSLVLSAAFALAASALFMIYRAKLTFLHGQIPFPIQLSFLGIGQASWGILAALSLANALYVTYCWLERTWEYKSLCARRSPLEHVVERG